MSFSRIASIKLQRSHSSTGSTDGAVKVDIAEVKCTQAMRLSAAYLAAWTALHDATDRAAKERALVALSRARGLHREHADRHGCLKHDSVKTPLESANAPGKLVRTEELESQLRADLLTAQRNLENAGAKVEELSRLSLESGVTSDGTVTLEEARELRIVARNRYLTALRRFSDYLV